MGEKYLGQGSWLSADLTSQSSVSKDSPPLVDAGLGEGSQVPTRAS